MQVATLLHHGQAKELHMDENMQRPDSKSLEDLKSAVSSKCQVNLSDIIPFPSCLDVAQLNMFVSCVMSMLQEESLGWFTSKDRTGQLAARNNYKCVIVHDALLLGQLFAICARNISWVGDSKKQSLGRQKWYSKPSNSTEFLGEYVFGLARVLDGSEPPPKALPNNWSLDREIFMLATGIRAYFDGFVTNYSMGSMTNEQMKTKTRIVMPGSFAVPSLSNSYFSVSSKDEGCALQSLRTLFRDSVQSFKVENNGLGNHAVVYNDNLKLEREQVVAQHVSFLLNEMQHFLVGVVPASVSAVSAVSTTVSTAASTTESTAASTAASITPANLLKRGNAKSPESFAKRSKTHSACNYIEYGDFKSRGNKFVEALNANFHNDCLQYGKLMDIDVVIDNVHFLMHEEAASRHILDDLSIDAGGTSSALFELIGGFTKNHSRSNTVMAPRKEEAVDEPDRLDWLKRLLPKDVALADVALRVPRLGKEEFEVLDDLKELLNMIAQYFMASITGIGPKLYGVVFYSTSQVSALSKLEPVTTAFLVLERIKGPTLFAVDAQNHFVRTVMMQSLIERMDRYNCYNFDSKEMNIMLRRVDGEADRLVFVDYDAIWSGFLLDAPQSSVKGINFHFFVFNTVLYLQKKNNEDSTAISNRWKQIAEFYLKNRGRNVDFENSPVLKTFWKGGDALVSKDGPLSTPVGIACHNAQMFVQRVAVDSTREEIFKMYKAYKARPSDAEIDRIVLCFKLFADAGRTVRYFVRGRKTNESLGDVLKGFNNIYLDTMDNTFSTGSGSLPSVCAVSELRTAIVEKDDTEVRSCLGFLAPGSRAMRW